MSRAHVIVTDEHLVGLECQDCDVVFVVYDPAAERGHPVSPHDLLDDEHRHSVTCGEPE